MLIIWIYSRVHISLDEAFQDSEETIYSAEKNDTSYESQGYVN